MVQEKRLVSFVRKPAKQGEAYIFTIPKNYIENNLIDPSRTYRLYIEDIGD